MPIKQVQCCICLQTVNKAQTLAVGTEGRRACRTHPDVDESAAKTQQRRKEAEQQITKTLEESRKKKSPLSDPDLLQPRCGCCKELGLRSDYFHLELLKASEKFEMMYGHPANPFDAVDNQHLADFLNKKVCLWVIKYEPTLKISRGARSIAQMIGLAMICTKCCEEQKLNYRPEINFDQIRDFAPFYEAFIRPGIKEMAEKEMTQEQKL